MTARTLSTRTIGRSLLLLVILAVAVTPAASADHNLGYQNCSDAGLRQSNIYCIDIAPYNYCWAEHPRIVDDTLDDVRAALPSEEEPEPEPRPRARPDDPGCSYAISIGGGGGSGGSPGPGPCNKRCIMLGFDAFTAGHRDQINLQYDVIL